MTNTERIYQAMKKFQSVRMAARSEYLETMGKLDTARGSQFYDDEQARAMTRRNERLDAAAIECKHDVDYALDKMREAVNKRQFAVPSDEMLRVLQLLQMRKPITGSGEDAVIARGALRTELDAAAITMNGNGSALRVLQEIADNLGVVGANYKAMAVDGLSRGDADETLRYITKSLGNNIADRVGARRAAVLAAEHAKRNHGTNYDADMLPAETPYESERDFYAGMLSVPFEVLDKTFN